MWTTVAGPGTLSFYWHFVCGSNPELQRQNGEVWFRVDGIGGVSSSGTGGWSRETFVLGRVHMCWNARSGAMVFPTILMRLLSSIKSRSAPRGRPWTFV